jgi:hypothetical protein
VSFLKSLSVQVLVGLALGLALGALAAAYGSPDAARAIDGLKALGDLWLNALRMTVVPLIFAVLVTGIAQVSDAAATGRLALRAVGWFAGLLVFSASFSTLWCNGLLWLWPVDETAAAALRAAARGPAANVPTAPDIAAWVRSLAPANPLKAATEDQILPLVVFAVFTGFALARLPADRGRVLVDAIQALGEAMIMIVRWVLLAAPLGVFCLGLGVGLHAGAGAAGVIGHYVVVAASAGAMITVFGYLMGMLVGRVPPGRWARATAPVLAGGLRHPVVAGLPAGHGRAHQGRPGCPAARRQPDPAAGGGYLPDDQPGGEPGRLLLHRPRLRHPPDAGAVCGRDPGGAGDERGFGGAAGAGLLHRQRGADLLRHGPADRPAADPPGGGGRPRHLPHPGQRLQRHGHHGHPGAQGSPGACG